MTDKETMPGLIWAIYDLGDQYRGVWYHEDKWSVDDCEAYIRADLHDAAIEAMDAEIRQLRALGKKITASAEEFLAYHDGDHKTCSGYGAECPIAMGEWFESEDRENLSLASALFLGRQIE